MRQSTALADEYPPDDPWFETPILMSNSEAFVETLRGHGCDTMFGIVGSAFMDALDLFEPAGIRFIACVHEQGSAHMADGYARVTNKTGFAIAQNGPGISNFVTGVAAAYWAHSPVAIITPEAGTMTKGHGGFQELDQLPVFSTVTKFQAHVNNPKRISELTAHALDIAQLERGPVQINIPRDFFYGDNEFHVKRPRKLVRSAGQAEALHEAAGLIANAKNPVIIAGGGVCMGDGVEEAKALAELLGAPVVCTYLHNDSFPASHPLAAGALGYQGSQAGMLSLRDADVVLALGTRLSPFGTLPQYGIDYWPKDAKVVQVDIDHRRLGLVKDVDVAVHGDAKLAAADLTRRLGAVPLVSASSKPERFETLTQRKADWEAKLDKFTLGDAPEGKIKPRAALRELEKAMPADVIVSTDIGNTCSVANSYLRFEKPRSMLAAMTFGNCGYALPAAIGAKVGAPHRPVVSYAGDGAWGMSMNELLTCVREDIPVTAVVFNNGQWGAEKKNQVLWFGDRYVGSQLKNPSFAEVARAMGAEAITVTRKEDVGPAFKKAIDLQINEGKTCVLELMHTKELGDPFRRDAMRLPTRRLPKFQAYTETAESATGQPTDIQQGAATSPH
jgi:sulfoacetaldehyde acetyltransferase